LIRCTSPRLWADTRSDMNHCSRRGLTIKGALYDSILESILILGLNMRHTNYDEVFLNSNLEMPP